MSLAASYWDDDDIIADIENRTGVKVEPEDRDKLARIGSEGMKDETRESYIAEIEAKQKRRMDAPKSSSGGSSAPSSSGSSSTSNYGVTLPQVPFTPFTQTFTPSLGALPSDLMQTTRSFIPDDVASAKWDRSFVAPDPAQMMNDPVVQARLAMGRQAFEASGAATGTLRTGGFAQRLNEFGQQVATDEYDKIYQRAMGEFQGAYGMFQGDLLRRQGVAGQQFAETMGDKSFRAGVYGDQTARDFGQFGLDYQINRNNQLDPFGMGTALYGLGQENQRIGQSQQALDFNIWNTMDTNYYDRLFRQAELGMPK